MTWFILTLACIILWGVTDVLYKASLYKNDPLSYYKTFVWVGIVMALAGFVMSNWSDTLLNSIKMVKDDVLYLVPLCLVYAIAFFFGLLGNKHLDASVVSTLENTEGALATIGIYYFYLLTGYTHPDYALRTIDVIATVLIIFAASINPILTAPITSLYCLVTIVMARIFLKERLNKKQYLSLGFLIAGIALLGVSGILSA